MNDIVVMILSTCSLEHKIIHLNSNIIHPLNTQVANCFDNPTRIRELSWRQYSQDWKCLILNETEFTNNIYCFVTNNRYFLWWIICKIPLLICKEFVWFFDNMITSYVLFTHGKDSKNTCQGVEVHKQAADLISDQQCYGAKLQALLCAFWIYGKLSKCLQNVQNLNVAFYV